MPRHPHRLRWCRDGLRPTAVTGSGQIPGDPADGRGVGVSVVGVGQRGAGPLDHWLFRRGLIRQGRLTFSVVAGRGPKRYSSVSSFSVEPLGLKCRPCTALAAGPRR